MAQEKAAMEKKAMEQKKKDEIMKKKDVTVEMIALNSSGQTGKTTLSDIDGKTKVVVEIISGAENIAQPSHIHIGSCIAPGSILYPLNAVQNGYAETILDVSLETIYSKLPLLVMAHKSKDEAKIFVSCGDLSNDK